MAKKEYTPFSGLICEMLRNCVKERRKAESKRDAEFENRDNAATMIEEAVDEEDREKAEAAYGRAVREIDVLGQKIKFCNTKIAELVEKADEPGLPYDSPQLEFPEFKPKAGKKHEEGGEPKQRDVPDQQEFTAPEGEDQHLAASVAELNLPDSLTKLLTGNGFTTVGAIVAKLDSEDGLEIKGVGDVKIAEITAAVKKYRRVHRAAMREAEQVA